MPLTVIPDWLSGTQPGLTGALAEVKSRLQERAEPSEPTLSNGMETVDSGSAPALESLCESFRLSPFERAIILLCAGIELDSSFAPLCAAAQGDPARNYPTFSLAFSVLPDAHWSAISPEGPLRHWRLIEVGSGPAITVSPLRIDERVLHHVVGLPYLDERLTAMIEPVGPVAAESLAPSHARLAERVAAVWTSFRDAGRGPLIQLYGPDAADRRAVAMAAASSLGLRLGALPAESIPAGPVELDSLARFWDREAALGGAVLLVECDDAEPGSDTSRVRAVRRLTERIAGLVLVSDRDRRPIGQRLGVSFDIPPPTAHEQRAAWQAAFGPHLACDPAEIDTIAAQFSLSLSAIRTAATEISARSFDPTSSDFGRTAWEVCRGLSRSRLDDLAQRIDTCARWDDLVLPSAQAEAVRRIALHVRHRARVHDAWGFAAKSGRGLGMNALFAGASGTGKTMAAEVIASELHLDLYRIDLSNVVSKYIGETEKNLRRVFDAAESSGAVLLFDEADALFGKRSEVKDSHDRYANIEVSYLLQRMEAYRGLAILTTNLKGALDPAFLRRIRFLVQFPFPDPNQRAEIWRRVFPATTPTDALDVWKLAKLNVPGGNIRNIAVNAAFLAAETGGPVRMCHLREAARIEYAKLERPLTEAEIGGWE